VSDGGRDCRRHNSNNRLDTRGIQRWIDDTIRQHEGAPPANRARPVALASARMGD